MEKATGVLKSWLGNYGFIRPDEPGSDVVVHAKDMGTCYLGQPGPGLRLAFDVIAGRGGRDKAINLELA
jgi:cold shock CspA family protein